MIFGVYFLLTHFNCLVKFSLCLKAALVFVYFGSIIQLQLVHVCLVCIYYLLTSFSIET